MLHPNVEEQLHVPFVSTVCFNRLARTLVDDKLAFKNQNKKKEERRRWWRGASHSVGSSCHMIATGKANVDLMQERDIENQVLTGTSINRMTPSFKCFVAETFHHSLFKFPLHQKGRTGLSQWARGFLWSLFHCIPYFRLRTWLCTPHESTY